MSQKKVDYFKNLNSKERNIIVNKGTEYPYTGKYNKHFEKGVYHCKACDSPLYNSNSKFESKPGHKKIEIIREFKSKINEL